MYRQEKYLQKPEGGAVQIVELPALVFFYQGCNVKGWLRLTPQFQIQKLNVA